MSIRPPPSAHLLTIPQATLIYPDLEATHRPNSLSNLLCTALRGFSSVQGMSQKVAVASMAYYVMRWLVAPTQENYDLMPEGLQPTSDQINIPHPIWIDGEFAVHTGQGQN